MTTETYAAVSMTYNHTEISIYSSMFPGIKQYIEKTSLSILESVPRLVQMTVSRLNRPHSLELDCDSMTYLADRSTLKSSKALQETK